MAVFSDLFDDVSRIITGLKHFRHRRHEVIVFHILDPAELDFPFRDTTLFKGLEDMADDLDRPPCAQARLSGRAQVVPARSWKRPAGWLTSTTFRCVPIRTSTSHSRATSLPARLESAEGSSPHFSTGSRPCHFRLFWALGFANLPLLYGLGAAAVPIVIHLLNRRKFREVSWAAMQFLLAALRKNRRRIRVEQWLLLAIRTLVVLLVVTAMAKPFLETFGAVIAGRRTHRVIVLDASLSMGYTSGESSRFDQAKALAVATCQGLAARRRDQRHLDGSTATGGDRRPLAQPGRSQEGDRRAHALARRR